MLYRKFIVRKHERGMLFKNGDFVRFLAPGTYRFFSLSTELQVAKNADKQSGTQAD